MSRKTVVLVLVVVAISLLAVVPTFAAAGGRPGSPVVVYVRSQGLYYDSIVGPELPPHGRFQMVMSAAVGGSTRMKTASWMRANSSPARCWDLGVPSRKKREVFASWCGFSSSCRAQLEKPRQHLT
jgi:hypothetical protein